MPFKILRTNNFSHGVNRYPRHLVTGNYHKSINLYLDVVSVLRLVHSATLLSFVVLKSWRGNGY